MYYVLEAMCRSGRGARRMGRWGEFLLGRVPGDRYYLYIIESFILNKLKYYINLNIKLT
jgi:hypothetical protein